MVIFNDTIPLVNVKAAVHLFVAISVWKPFADFCGIILLACGFESARLQRGWSADKSNVLKSRLCVAVTHRTIVDVIRNHRF